MHFKHAKEQKNKFVYAMLPFYIGKIPFLIFLSLKSQLCVTFQQNIGRAQADIIGRAQRHIGRAWALPGL